MLAWAWGGAMLLERRARESRESNGISQAMHCSPFPASISIPASEFKSRRQCEACNSVTCTRIEFHPREFQADRNAGLPHQPSASLRGVQSRFIISQASTVTPVIERMMTRKWLAAVMTAMGLVVLGTWERVSLSAPDLALLDSTSTSSSNSSSSSSMPSQVPVSTTRAAAYSVVVMGAYRRGPSAWQVLILAGGVVAKDDDPGAYSCRWYSAHHDPATAFDSAKAASWEKPGHALMRTSVYIPVVITCDFSSPVGADGIGGAIVLSYANPGNNVGGIGYAAAAAAAGRHAKEEDEWMVHQVYGWDDGGVGELRILAGTEKPGTYNASTFHVPPAYQHLYCGSPLYGTLNGQALHEWISFHFHQLGNRSHFVFHDVGGMSEDIRSLLAPWTSLGILQIEDLRHLNQFDGYYYNQYLILNHCLLKARHMAEWVWFFDVDEYVVVKPPFANMDALLHKYRDRGELQFEQHLFSNNVCPLLSTSSPTNTNRTEAWVIETLLFAVKGGSTYRSHKWAANPRKVSAAAVHFALTGWRHTKAFLNSSESSYFHYHDTISKKQGELCQRWVKEEEYKNLSARFHSTTERLEYDDSLLPLARAAKLQSAQYLRRNGF